MSKKFLVFLGLHAILLVFWIAHLVAIQLIDIYRFDKQSVVKQRYKNRKRILQSIRGDIYDARNNLLVSTNKYYRLEINRTAINDNLPEGKTKKSFYNEIAEFFDKNTHISKESILTKFSYSKNKVDYIYISKKMTIDELLKIQKFFKEKDISCLTYNFSHMNRIYTQNNIANRLLGSTYSQFDPHKNMFNQIYKLKGLTGIEKSYDEYLLGKYGWLEGRLDGSGDFIQMPDSREKEAVNGNSIQLTIDKNIQEIVERHLAAGLTKFEAKNGVAVVIEPSTGKILALSSINKDDAGKQEREIRLSSNLGVSFLFEPGSTFKSLPILLALEDNLYDWTTKIDCSTLVTEYDRKISDHKRFDEFNLKNLLTYSSNPGISRVVEKVGKYRYWSFLKDVGFGRGSGLDLKGENSGKLRHHTRWSAYSLHSLAFGQEISVNIVQLAKVYAAIANGGKMMRPYLLEKVISPKGEIVEHFKPKFEKTIGSKASIDTLKSYLKNVVDNGTATIAQFNGISCAGKTGTAEKTISKNDDETTYYTSFAGFLPVENPKYAIVVMYDEPKDPFDYASASATPVFKDIVSEVIQLDYCTIIPETKFAKDDIKKVPNVINSIISNAKIILQENNLDYELIQEDGANIVTTQIPAAGALVSGGKKVILKAENYKSYEKKYEENIIPNFVGLTVKEAYSVATANYIDLKATGNGIIKNQTPTYGKSKKFGEVCRVVAR